MPESRDKPVVAENRKSGTPPRALARILKGWSLRENSSSPQAPERR